MGADTVSSQKTVSVPNTTTKSRESQKFRTRFAATDGSLFDEAQTVQARQVQRASSVVHIDAASSSLVTQSFYTLLREKALSLLVLTGSTFLRSVLSKKKTSVMNGLSQSVPTFMEALHSFGVSPTSAAALKIAVFMRKRIKKRGAGSEWLFSW